MRSIRSAGAALTLAGIATFAGAAAPAFAAGPQIDATPSVAAPGGSVAFSVVCGDKADSAILFGVTIGLSEHIPMEKSTHKGVFVSVVKLPATMAAGKYSPSVDCSNGDSGVAAFTVKAAWVKPAVVVPAGAPVTGDGITSTAVGGPLTAVGIGLLGLSGLAGAFFAIRRRKSGAAK